MRATRDSNREHINQSGDNSVHIGKVSGGSININMNGIGEERYQDVIARLDKISFVLQNKNSLCVNTALPQNSFWRKCVYSAKVYFSKMKTVQVVLKQCTSFDLWEETEMTKAVKYLLNNMYDEVLLCASFDSNLDCETSERKVKRVMYEFTKAITPQQKRGVDGFVSYVLHCVREHLETEENYDYISHIITNTDLSIKEELKTQYSKLLSAIEYENSFAQHINEICITKRVINNPLHYLSSQVRFYGREKEISLINNFVNEERLFSFSVITGDGGSGKSKLVYYYLKLYLSADWKAVYLSVDDIDSLIQKCKDCPYPDKLFITVDYAGKSPENLGKLIDLLSSKVKFKTRMLLIERQGMVSNNFPHWYYRLIGTGEKRENLLTLYFQMSEAYFLELSYLSETAFREMAQDYANAFQEKRNILTTDWNEIWSHAIKIENRKTPRPLIVLFITDAFIHGGNFDKWDTTKLIEYIVNRYDEHTWRRACGDDVALYNSVIRVLAFATASGAVEFSHIPEILKSDVDIMFNSTSKISFDENTTHALVCAINQSTEYEARIKGFEPDIAGECFVLLWLVNNEYSSYKKQLWEYMWEHRGQSMETFTLRCVSDFVDFENFKRLFINEMEELLTGCKNDLFIARILLSYTQATKAIKVETLEAVNHKINWSIADEDTVTAYVNEILAFYSRSDSRESITKNIMNMLRDIAITSIHVETAMQHYVKFVIDYSSVQLERCKNTILHTNKVRYVKKLELISVEHDRISKVEEIYIEALCDYSHSLLSLISDSDIIRDRRIVSELRNIAKQNPNCIEIISCYAKSLQILFVNYKSTNCKNVIEQLYDLRREYVSVEAIADISTAVLKDYSCMLLYLITGRNLVEDERIVDELRNVVKQNSNCIEVVKYYAKALQKLFSNYKSKNVIEQLYNLNTEYLNDEIQSIYSNTVINYVKSLSLECMHMNIDSSYTHIEELITLAEGHCDLSDISFMVVKTVVNVYFNQFSKDRAVELEKLMYNVISKITGSTVIICDVINSFLKKTSFRNISHAVRTKEILSCLVELSDNERGISFLYAKCLVKLIDRLEFIEIEELISELEIMSLYSGREFLELYNDTIVKISSRLRNEIIKNDVYEESHEFQLLKNLLSSNKNVDQLVCDYARVLKCRCLFSGNSLINSTDFTKELRDLYLEYNDNPVVAETYHFVIQSFIKQIVNLVKQQNYLDEVGCEIFSAMSRLEDYHKDYIENIKWWNAKMKYEYLEWLILIYSESDFSETVKSVIKNISKSTDINFIFEASESQITLEVLEALRETTQFELIDSYAQCYSSM